jgi:hypothetical protein
VRLFRHDLLFILNRMFLDLVALNFIVWWGGLLWLKGLARNYITIIVFIFSGSYWLPVLFFNDGNISRNINIDFVPINLLYSVIAGIFFYAGFFLIRKKSAFHNIRLNFDCRKGHENISSALLPIIKISAFINIFIMAILSVDDVGVGDRVYFLDEVRPFWYLFMLPLSSILISAWIILDKNAVVINSIRRDWLLWLSLLLHIALVGFDGSRRSALPPLLLISLKVIIHNILKNNSFFAINKKTFLLIVMAFFSTLMTLNRAFDVGWGILTLNLYEYYEYIPTFFQLLTSFSPTIHVNTQMLDLVNQEGVHGYGSYLRALGNFLFPKFIFGDYFFGEPLVLELHDRFGWYGQDFGFMAEAIYSDGLIGVSVLHFLYGSFVAKTLNGFASKKYAAFFQILAVCIVFGAINSLRSDFMNLLKATFYPALGIYIIFIIILYSRKVSKRI